MARAKTAATAATEQTDGPVVLSDKPMIDPTAADAKTNAGPGAAEVSEPKASAPDDTTADPDQSLPTGEKETAEVPAEQETVQGLALDASTTPEAEEPAAQTIEGANLWPEKFGHVPLMDLRRNGKKHLAGRSIVYLTLEEFEELRAAKVFSGEWDDGFEGPGDEKPE